MNAQTTETPDADGTRPIDHKPSKYLYAQAVIWSSDQTRMELIEAFPMPDLDFYARIRGEHVDDFSYDDAAAEVLAATMNTYYG